MVVMRKWLLLIFSRNGSLLVDNWMRGLVKFWMLNKIIFCGFDWFVWNVKGWRKIELFSVIFGCIVNKKLFFMFIEFLCWDSPNRLYLNFGFFLFHPVPSFLVGLSSRLSPFFPTFFIIFDGKIIVFRLKQGRLRSLGSWALRLFGRIFFCFQWYFFLFYFIEERIFLVKTIVLFFSRLSGNEARIVPTLLPLTVTVAWYFLIFEGETHMISILFIVFESITILLFRWQKCTKESWIIKLAYIFTPLSSCFIFFCQLANYLKVWRNLRKKIKTHKKQ